ncbi:hypothetical protein [Desulfosudis oleivorans]|uniref:Uncharacterized protein n=1 Tax=Desulfosudis oleivorans (strain DSM 6200 / JCM 39069 / Hxd3) TaxID=96561 RepID=A9A076_DESOH|nr:hypothetical protein [Desulfosudis oleivorans]ABW68995.1 hypothetical protein Dole_3192 [Desulfosudis oleivorans Hxd3]
MERNKNYYFIIIRPMAVLLVGTGLLLLTGCAMGPSPRPAPYPAEGKEDIAGRIAQLEERLAWTIPPEEKGRLLVQLAMLYAHPDNPGPDYKKALSCMKDCADMQPPVDGRFVSALLVQLDACAARAAAVDLENAKLKQQAAALEQENQDHKNVIEKLKRLDIQLEKRRKNMQ